MNKKFLSAILFVAMLVTSIGTFVSCKDYDDDISSLQSQIDGLSSSSSSQSASLTSLQASLESELTSVKSSLESELTSATSTLENEITAAKADLQVAMSSKADASEITSLSDRIYNLTSDLAATESSLTTQITAVDNALSALKTSSESANAALQATVDALSASSSDADLQIKAAIDGLKSSTDASDTALQAAIDSLEAKCNTSSAALNEAISKLQSNSNDADEALDKAIKALTETSDSNYAELKAAIEDLASTAASSEELEAAIEKLEKAAATDYQTLLEQITALQTSGNEAYAELLQLIKDQTASSDEADAGLQLLIDALTTSTAESIAKLQDTDADLLTSIKDLESSTNSAYEELVASIKELGSTDKDLQASITALETSTSASIADLTELISDLAASSVSSASLYQIIENLNIYIDSSINSLAQDLTSYKSYVADSYVTLDVLEGKLADEEAARKAADQELYDAILKNVSMQYTTLDEYQTKMAELDSEIDGLKKSMSSDVAANYSELDNKIDSIQGVLTQQIATIQTYIDDSIAPNIAELQSQMGQISTAISSISGSLSNITVLVKVGITSIELVYSYAAQADGAGTDLVFENAIEKTTVFGEGLEGAITFTDGVLYKKKASLLVRVSPISADLSNADIRFVNSNGEVLENIVKIDSIARYNQLLTKAAVETGLWTITLEVEDGLTPDDFSEATKANGKQILFAVQVNNTLNEDEERYATSTYDVTMKWTEYEPAEELYFNVDDTPVAQIANRYKDKVGNTFLDEPYTDVTYEELCWYAKTSDIVVPDIKENINKDNTAIDGSDDRTEEETFETKVDQKFTVSLKDEDGNDPENIRAMYVTLDYEEFAVESNPSEWVAWDAFAISGLNKVVEGTSVDITVTDSRAKYDIIGFRVFAVNYDGTLVDPDGKAFYVQLGKEDTDWGNPATTIVPVSDSEFSTPSDTSTDIKDMSDVSLSKAVDITWVTEASTSGGLSIFNIVLTDSKGNIVAYTRRGKLYDASGNEADSSTDLTSVTGVYTTVLDKPTDTTSNRLQEWYKYEDGTPYTGTLTVTNDRGRVIGSLTVTMMKVLPEGIPSPYSATIKTSQLASDGIYYAFMVPNDGNDDWPAADGVGATATSGNMVMTSVFNFYNGSTALNEDDTLLDSFVIDWSDSSTTSADGTQRVTGSETLSVDIDYVDDTTKHTVSLGWNYGKISSATPYEDYVSVVEAYTAVYVCLYNEDAYTWAWQTQTNEDGSVSVYSDIDLLTYDTQATVLLGRVRGTCLADGKYNGDATTGYKNDSGDGTLVITDEDNHLITNEGERVDEYFTVSVNTTDNKITFTPVSNATNPRADVPSTLVLTGVDCYGHTVTIELPMTVQVR